MSEQPKRCPFCGGWPLVEKPKIRRQRWGVHCPNHGQHGHVVMDGDTEAEAIQAWNQRAL